MGNLPWLENANYPVQEPGRFTPANGHFEKWVTGKPNNQAWRNYRDFSSDHAVLGHDFGPMETQDHWNEVAVDRYGFQRSNQCKLICVYIEPGVTKYP